jgi:RHS repeat-associated protein
LYSPEIVTTTDYYPFGAIMPGRNFNAGNYRFGFSGVEQDNEVKGNGNSLEFKFRIYDPRLGRFLSVDPISSNYPWNSPYAYAENRPIDGIDLEGLEYLKADEARIQVTGGLVKLKISNFIQINQNAFNNANNNSKNWKKGEIGINTTIATIQGKTASQVNMPFLQSNAAKGDVNANYPDRAPAVSPTYDDANPTASAPGGTRGAAAGVAVVNAINFGLEQYAVWSAWYDQGKVNEHKSLLFNQVTNDVNKALKQGLIPEKYQNATDMGNIMNVVLQGVNNTDNKDIYNIGMKIYNTISNPPMKTITVPSGLDNYPSRTIVVPEVDAGCTEECED